MSWAKSYCKFSARIPLTMPLPVLVAQFDALHSLEISEKIKKVRWCPRPNHRSLCMLATNDRTVKLWKVPNAAIIINGTERRRIQV